MYFWRQRDSSPAEQLPDFTLDPAIELASDFQRAGLTPGKAGGEPWEWIVFHWLNNIAETGQLRAQENPSLRWLSESGLLEALKKAHIELSTVQ
jgi:hypothetical protein